MTKSVRLIALETVDSTNLYVRRLAECGAPAGTAVFAREQTAGRGRLGRSFASPAGGGLYLSVLLRPRVSAADAALLTATAALAAAEVLEEMTAEKGTHTDIGIKWVNDLYLGGKKLAGILAESALTSEGGVAYSIVGIGINLFAQRLPASLSHIATSLEESAGVILDCAPLARRLAEAILHRSARLEAGDWGEDEYRRRMILFGKTVTVTRGSERFLARACDVTARGELAVQRQDGRCELLAAGEVTLHREGDTL